ncbi:hypothetical protein S7711_03121 [Stachybotrys chartarum IBT 7711]|uniref:Uncharacterized protein n=1 Tax=Stachybotrys chartarum (strain CBS 109288 / IBT 7711) TaxID=1280523 RepID=A0A084B8E4_STACB|nr:hypothetical protein S7711_03121 [Stachybotrys chartarum IBT 7711]
MVMEKIPALALLGAALPYLVTCSILLIIYLSSHPRPLPGIAYNKEASKSMLGDMPTLWRAKYRRTWVQEHPRSHGVAISQVFLNPFSWAKHNSTVLLTDHREVLDILSRRTKEFDRSQLNERVVGMVAPNFHYTMMSSDPRFKLQRELLKDVMTPVFLSNVAAPRAHDRAQHILALWELKLQKGQGRPFAADHDLFLGMLDIISSVAFGMEGMSPALQQEAAFLETINPNLPASAAEPVSFDRTTMSREVEALLDIPEMLAIGQGSPFPKTTQILAALFRPKHARAFWHQRSLMVDQTNKALRKVTDGGEDTRSSALDYLVLREMKIAERLGRKPNSYSPAIRDELLGFLLAGHHTNATTLAWWTKYMSRFPLVQCRLRAELRAAHPAAVKAGRLPSAVEIQSTVIPYLDAVLEESMRYAGVITIVTRTATCDTEVLGSRIPKGTDIMLFLTGPSYTEPAVSIPEHLRSASSREHKNTVPEWGDDVALFKPERWLRKTVDEVTGQEMDVFEARAGPSLPFAAGPRQCFGKKLAYLQLRTVMTLLTWTFEFGELDKGLNTDDVFEAFVNNPKDCYVKLSRCK